MTDPVPKDVVTGIFGASAGLGGLVLVFLGLVISSYQTLPPAAASSVKARARRAGPLIVAVFALSLTSVGLSLAWLAAPGGDLLYHLVIWAFVVDLIAVFVLAGAMSWKMLR